MTRLHGKRRTQLKRKETQVKEYKTHAQHSRAHQANLLHLNTVTHLLVAAAILQQP